MTVVLIGTGVDVFQNGLVPWLIVVRVVGGSVVGVMGSA